MNTKTHFGKYYSPPTNFPITDLDYAVNTINNKCCSCDTHTTQYWKNGSFPRKRITNSTHQHFPLLRKPTTSSPTPLTGKSLRRWGSGRKGKLMGFRKKKEWVIVQRRGWVLLQQQTALQYNHELLLSLSRTFSLCASRFHSNTAKPMWN